MVRWLVPLVVLLASACGPKAADYDPANLARRFEAVRGGLEAALGEAYGDAPEFAIVTDAEMARIIAKENTYFHGKVRGGPRGAALFLANSKQANALAKMVLAKLDIETGRILVNPASFKTVADAAPEYREVGGAPFLDLIIVHETVHLWQHRRYGMGKFVGQPETTEEIMCRLAVIEGHAQHVAAAAAESLGLSEEFALLERLNSEVPSSVDDPGVRLVLQAMTTFFSFQYMEGREFVDAVVAELGNEAGVARVFEHPPAMVRHVGRPAEYLAGGGAGKALRAAAEKVGRLIRRPFARTQIVTLTGDMLRKNLVIADARLVEQAMAEYVDGIVIISVKGALSPTMEYIIAILELETPEGADRFLELERVVDKAKNAAFADPGGPIQIQNPSHRKLTVEGRDAFYSAKQVRVGAAAVVSVRNLVLKSGTRIVEITAQGDDHSLDELSKLAPKILALLEAD